MAESQSSPPSLLNHTPNKEALCLRAPPEQLDTTLLAGYFFPAFAFVVFRAGNFTVTFLAGIFFAAFFLGDAASIPALFIAVFTTAFFAGAFFFARVSVIRVLTSA